MKFFRQSVSYRLYCDKNVTICGIRYDYSTSYPDAENPDEEIDLNSLDDTGFELMLPSGAKVGHRSLVR